jgi:hypothetical protein
MLAAMLIVGTLSVPHAGAATPWKNFGNGSAIGRGDFGNPLLTVQSTTKQNPVRVRFMVTGDAIKTDISWDIECWNDFNFKSRFASASFTTKPPVTKDLSNGSWVSNFQFCELDVSADRFGGGGSLQVKLQAKYPS